MTPMVFIYDRMLTSATRAVEYRLGRCLDYAAHQGWDCAGRWLEVGDEALDFVDRPQLDAMLTYISNVPDVPRVCLVPDWSRLAHSAAGRTELARRILATGAWIETISGDRRMPSGDGPRLGRLTSVPGSVTL